MTPVVVASSRGTNCNKTYALIAVVVLISFVIGGICYFRGRESINSHDARSELSAAAEGMPQKVAVKDLSANGYETNVGGNNKQASNATDIIKAKTVANGLDVAISNAEETESLDEVAYMRKEGRLKHRTEQLLGMIISGGETGVPPLPISEDDEEILRADLLNAITNDIVIFDAEDHVTQEVKEKVAKAKLQLKEILEGGGSVVAAIKEFEAFVNEGARLRDEVIEQISPEVDAIADDAEAIKYVETVNEALSKEEIPSIHLNEVGFETTDDKDVLETP